MSIDGQTFELNPVAYTAQATPVPTGMNPRFGSVYGGESIELYGTGFSERASTSVLIDGRPCSVTAQTRDKIVCTTSDKPFVEG